MPPLGSVIARDVVTPVTTVLFGFITVTGLMLMLHVRPAWCASPTNGWGSPSPRSRSGIS